MKRAPVDTVLKVNVTETEKTQIQEAANAANLSLSAYARRIMFARPLPLPPEVMMQDVRRAEQILDEVKSVSEKVDSGDLDGLRLLHSLYRIEKLICRGEEIYLFPDIPK